MKRLLEVDVEALSVRVRGRQVPVTGLQLRLLVFLAKRPDWVRTREQILKEVWGRNADGRDAKLVDVLVCRLRRRLGEAGSCIASVRNYGYRLEIEDDAPASTSAGRPGKAGDPCDRS